jgi:DNA polymerase
MDLIEKTELLKEVADEVIVCTKCNLSKTRTLAVPGEGSPGSEILFVGEGPGVKEDLSGRPFCGPAGKFLDEMLASIELDRNKVFITNIVKCRPPENRDPEDGEKDACWSYLEKQIQILDPKLIITLGRHSMMRLLPGMGTISKIHGKPFRRPDGRIYLPLYHPSAALHNGSLRPVQMQDFQIIPKLIATINRADLHGSNSRIDTDKNQEQISIF